MRRPNHASRFEGIAKTKLQASRASDTETLQSQVNKAAKKRLSLSGLEILHGRLTTKWSFEGGFSNRLTPNYIWSQIILPFTYHAESLSAPVPNVLIRSWFQLPRSEGLRAYRSGSGNSTNAPKRANSCIIRTSGPRVFLIKSVLFKASERMIPWLG